MDEKDDAPVAKLSGRSLIAIHEQKEKERVEKELLLKRTKEEEAYQRLKDAMATVLMGTPSFPAEVVVSEADGLCKHHAIKALAELVDESELFMIVIRPNRGNDGVINIEIRPPTVPEPPYSYWNPN
jgi:hypothetical protein